MGKQSRSKRSENLGKGKVTPLQVAFIVDRYLCDNHFNETRSLFRSEASSLIAKSPVREAPKTLLTLDAILNEYICLKEQKVMVNQERARLEHEKIRVQNLLQGMQNVMTAYNASESAPSPAIQAATQPTAVDLQPNTIRGSPSGCPVYNTPNVMPVSLPFNKRVECGNFLTPSTSHSQTRKRKSSEVSLGTSQAARKTHKKTTSQNTTSIGPGTDKLLDVDGGVSYSRAAPCPSEMRSSPAKCATKDPSVQGSAVAKCLFNQAVASSPINSTCPKTPQEARTDTALYPQRAVTPREITPSNCTIISKERITISPLKQFACYTVSRSHCVSSSSPAKNNLKMSNKRDHVKGRLNFDDSDMLPCSDKPITVDANSSSTSESEKETDFLDMDFPNLDILGENFSFSELLVDLDLACEGAGYPCPPLTSSFPMETVSGSSPDSRDCNVEADRVASEYSSTVTEVISGKDTITQVSDAMTAVKSITKCIRISSPAKSCRQRNT